MQFLLEPMSVTLSPYWCSKRFPSPAHQAAFDIPGTLHNFYNPENAIMMEKSGHFPFLEKTELTMEILRKFLNK